MRNLNPFPTNHPGTYALLIVLTKPETLAVGKLGDLNLGKGSYCYVGSALRGLRARVARHLRREKKIRWHIDYLLERETVTGVLWIHSEERLECVIVGSLRDQGLASVKGFGASDCRCPSHLFHHPSEEGLKFALEEAFRQAAGPPHSLEVAV